MNLDRRTIPTMRERLEFALQAPAYRDFSRAQTDTLVPETDKDTRLPMVFQYNPLMHHFEVNEHNEVVGTITRGGDGPFAGDSGKIKQARFLPAA